MAPFGLALSLFVAVAALSTATVGASSGAPPPPPPLQAQYGAPPRSEDPQSFPAQQSYPYQSSFPPQPVPLPQQPRSPSAYTAQGLPQPQQQWGQQEYAGSPFGATVQGFPGAEERAFQGNSPLPPQQQQQQGYYDPQRYGPPSQPVMGSPYSQMRRFGRPAQEGFLSRVRSSLATAGQVLSQSIESLAQPTQLPPTNYPALPYAPHTTQLPHTTPTQAYGYTQPHTQSHTQHTQGEGLVSRLRTIFSTESESDTQPSQPSHTSPYTPYTPPTQHTQHTQHTYDTHTYAHTQRPAAPLSPPTQSVDERESFASYSQTPLNPSTQYIQPRYTQPTQPTQPAHTTPTEPTERDREPQMFAHTDKSVVCVLRPHTLREKVFAMRAAGPQSVQVFADFEHAMTRFRLSDGAPALSTAEALENSGALSANAFTQIRTLCDEFSQSLSASQTESESSESALSDDAAFEELAQKVQQIVATSGELYGGHVSAITRAALPRLGLRDGWRETLQLLASQRVPTILFSSGYGDVVCQALMQAGLTDTQAAPAMATQHTHTTLPQNLRVISNFFRTAPDGVVRAFSTPVVHERNKNATTAQRHMDMVLPRRPHAIVLGSHEDDVHMTDGLPGIQEQISIGFLELTEDLPQRLPTYLTTFDVVVVGDASLHYVHSLLEDVLAVPHTQRETLSQGTAAWRRRLGGLFLAQNDNGAATTGAAQSMDFPLM